MSIKVYSHPGSKMKKYHDNEHLKEAQTSRLKALTQDQKINFPSKI